MEPQNAAQSIYEGMDPQKSQRRASFSPIKAIRSLSISSQMSQLSTTSTSETELSSGGSTRKRKLLKTRPSDLFRKDDLMRRPSKASTVDTADYESISTRPTSPSLTGSQGTSISGDFTTPIKFGALQPETTLLKTKKEFLVLTPIALLRFKTRIAAAEQFPQISPTDNFAGGLSPIESQGSSRGFGIGAESCVPLEKVVSAFKDEGTRPSFGIEVWWRSSDAASTFACVQLDFSLPRERDDWLKAIQRAVKSRGRAFMDDRTPADIELDFRLILQAKHRDQKDAQIDIYPVVPRRPYTRLGGSSGEVRKNWRDASSFYLAFTKNSLLLAQFSKSSTGQKVNPSLVQFGLVTLSRVNTNMNDDRFDLIFRLPLDQPTKVELSTRYYRSILSKLFKADTYLKPAWPLWTRREVFLVDGEAQQIPLPNGEDYGGFKTTLEAFLEGYHCPPVDWTVKWKNVRYAPEFRLLPPTQRSQYTAHQLLAVFRALRFNDYFKSLSFCDVGFSNLSNVFDNTRRLESTIWLSRTGKRSLTRGEFDLLEGSSVLFQELVSLLLGSEAVKHIDLSNVLNRARVAPAPGISDSPPPSNNGICEIVPPVVLLWKSLQTRCVSVRLSGNALSEADIIEIGRAFQNRPSFIKSLDVSRCDLCESALVYFWEGLYEQRSSIEVLDTSHNPGFVEATRVSYVLNGARRVKRLNLAHSIKGNLNEPLFRPWSSTGSFAPWRLEELDLSGWKINFDTLCGIMKYLELDESYGLRRLTLNNCGLSGEMATGILCRVGGGRDINLQLSENHLEVGSTDWIDLIHGNEAPRMLHMDMIQFQHDSNFNRLLTALSHNQTIEFLSMVGTGPPARAGSKTSELLSTFFETNDTLKFLDLSGYSGKLEDGHLGWGLSGALGGLKQNKSLLQLRIQNHDIGAAEDVSELCRVLAANRGLAMFDCRNNNFDHHQFAKLVNALSFNHQLISFPISGADRDYAIQKERRIFMQHQDPTGKSQAKGSKTLESRLDGLLSWLRDHWDTEAKKAQAILHRNREDPMNQLLELESEYIDAWDDDLPCWLKPTPGTNQKGKGKAVRSHSGSLDDESSITPTNLNPAPRVLGISIPNRKTYMMEEASSGSESGPSSRSATPPDPGSPPPRGQRVAAPAPRRAPLDLDD
ncbi:Uu.00g059190.m01.CDS01 [Anthostomella pinea]|uniref:Uu.00g059190.m01.CDS01 n=1 Tax=Anthostomella pinea TaxID=933095 RepID=A0AAI8VSU0_9PEZI|nr:Uu.00g059190.m01.CDS01 [Anthostomella pinea]